MNTYFTYILTNPFKTVLYIGATNDLARRVREHFENKGNPTTFTGKYYCYQLIYFEEYTNIEDVIYREKEIKKWNRKKKESLIATQNPEWEIIVV